MKKGVIVLVLLALVLGGCAQRRQEKNNTVTGIEPGEKIMASEDIGELFSKRDYETDYGQGAVILLEGTAASCDSNAVSIDGTTVTITDGGTYILRGSLDGGQILVRADEEDKTRLVLESVTLHNGQTAPLYIEQADKVFVTLVGENKLSAGGFPEDSNVDGVIFSKEDLTLNGSGSLTVASATGHGIVSKDELTVTGGSYHITAAAHGIAGKDNVCIDGGSFAIAAGKDGIHAENNDDEELGFVYIADGAFSISAEGDGISAGDWMQLDGGEYEITTGGGSENGSHQSSGSWGNMGGAMGLGGMGGKPGRWGMGGNRGGFTATAENTDTSEDSTSIKGIKAGTKLVTNGGSYTLNTADDGLHSNGDLSVTNGILQIASGDDGIHAEETLTVTGGQIRISESYEGLEALHVQIAGGDITLTARDDGLNAAGGTDQSGIGGRDMFGGMGGRGGMYAGNGSITISGGTLDVTASGDGIDANGTLEITGGYTMVCGPTYGDTATLDYDTSGVIRGGTFIGTGAAGMAQSFSDSEQGVIALRVDNGQAGIQIRVLDGEGKELLSHKPELDFAVVILSCPEMVKSQSYTLEIGSQTQTVTAC